MDDPISLKHFAWKGLLWLPTMFFLWFWFAEPLAWPVIRLSGWILVHSWPSLFDTVEQHGFMADIVTRVLVNQPDAQGQLRLGALTLSVNSLVYGYPLPLFYGLVLAIPLTVRKRALQITIGMISIWLVQSFGVVTEALKLVAFDSGQQGMTAIQLLGISNTVIALAYQAGYLLFPAIVPIMLWTALNQSFVKTLIKTSDGTSKA